MANNNISRRGFLKVMGAGATVAAGAAMESCQPKQQISVAGTHTGPLPTGQMTMRENPNTGDKVSVLGYGFMRLPTVDGGSARETAADIDQERVNELTDVALAHGINYFDTSPAYCRGGSERSMGIALSRYPRNSYYIATKMSNFAPAQFPREASMALFENSLKELQTDYIDYYLLHGIGMGGGLKEFNERFIDNGILDWLVEQKKAGRIRNLGFSYHGDIKVFDLLLQWHDEGKYHWDFAQIQLNYMDWLHAKEINARNTNGEYLYGELNRRGIPVVVMEPLLGGRLSRLPDDAVVMLKQRRPEDSVASWAFRWVASLPGVLTALSGMTMMEHLEDNLRSLAPLVPLTEDDKEYLEQTTLRVLATPTIQCNDCKYCMPCPYGLDIPAIFIHYNKCAYEKNIPTSKGDSNYRSARRAFLVGYDRSVPKLRQASHCTGCNQCSPHCPQRIDIPGEMQRIDKYVEALKQETI